MSDQAQNTTTWPDLAISLYDVLTGRGAKITYEFENMEVMVPSSTRPDAPHARWKVNGSLRISTTNNGSK